MRPHLNEGEVYCPSCDGHGERFPRTKIGIRRCRRCRATGKLDWIEVVVGKKHKPRFTSKPPPR